MLISRILITGVFSLLMCNVSYAYVLSCHTNNGSRIFVDEGEFHTPQFIVADIDKAPMGNELIRGNTALYKKKEEISPTEYLYQPKTDVEPGYASALTLVINRASLTLKQIVGDWRNRPMVVTFFTCKVIDVGVLKKYIRDFEVAHEANAIVREKDEAKARQQAPALNKF